MGEAGVEITKVGLVEEVNITDPMSDTKSMDMSAVRDK